MDIINPVQILHEIRQLFSYATSRHLLISRCVNHSPSRLLVWFINLFCSHCLPFSYLQRIPFYKSKLTPVQFSSMLQSPSYRISFTDQPKFTCIASVLIFFNVNIGFSSTLRNVKFKKGRETCRMTIRIKVCTYRLYNN